MTNKTILQYFHWYSAGEGNLYKEIKFNAAALSKMGITDAWLPPACKAAAGADSVGYDIYDLYDLGEFEQKGTVATKYGSKKSYLEAIQALKAQNIKVISDIVLNHKAGGDELEKFMAVKVDMEDRTKDISAPIEISSYTKFNFPGRGDQYSSFKWNYACFSGVDYSEGADKPAIYNIQNEWGNDWEEVIDIEKGNYDYLMFNDIEFRNPAVREELFQWGIWLMKQTNFDGVRLDAVKHISPRFYNEWLDRLRKETGKEIFAVGEYWAPGLLPLLIRYSDATEGRMHLFDSSLHHNLHLASNGGNEYDLTRIFDETLTAVRPQLSVTVVDNHDTQPLQALEAPVEAWFKPLAYALILLREAGIPCIFYPDLYGATYTDKGHDGNDHDITLAKVEELEALIGARRDHAYGEQKDYFDFPNCIGWTRLGDESHSGCAVIVSNGDDGNKVMQMGERYAGKTFVDLLQKRKEKIVLDENGQAEFLVNAASVSVWVESKHSD